LTNWRQWAAPSLDCHRNHLPGIDDQLSTPPLVACPEPRIVMWLCRQHLHDHIALLLLFCRSTIFFTSSTS
jgi:hypothetical protein